MSIVTYEVKCEIYSAAKEW